MNTPSESSSVNTSECDVAIIGGGPAGSTAAALLAERGYRVTLLEKAHHPRFHIGESLLPANLPLLEKLGVADEVKAIGMEKWGAEFVSPWHDHKQAFEFADALDKSMPMAYQVRRSEFDEILIRNASRKNARVVEGCQVHDVNFLPANAGVLIQARHDDGSAETVHARFVLDASGRDTFLGNRFKAKQRNKQHNSAAIYGHFTGAERNPGKTRVWTRGRKIASIGVHARQWVTWHGFALNVTTDLSFFDLMVPCGIAGVEMTSVSRELVELELHATDHDDALSARAREAIIQATGEVLELVPQRIDRGALAGTAGMSAG